MSKKLQGILIGIIIGVTITSGLVGAEQLSKTINAFYMNIKMVVDGVEITPKDANGKVVEPFAYNGTTYLPIRAVGDAFGKEVSWDGETATVYIGGIVEKPAKEVFLFDKSYIECSNASDFQSGKQSKDGNGNMLNNYIGFKFYPSESVENNRARESRYAVYPLNGVAKKVTGTFISPVSNRSPELQIKFYNENNTLLYQSPIMTASSAPIDFEFDVLGAISLKVEVTGEIRPAGSISCYINNLAILTTDY